MRASLVPPYDPLADGALVDGVVRVYAVCSRCPAVGGHPVTVVCTGEDGPAAGQAGLDS